MKSKIAEKICLKTQPVAVFRSKEIPEDAMQFRKGVWGCVVAMLNAASKGKTAAFDEETVTCPGGKAGLGIESLKKRLGMIEYFLSVGGKGPKAGELYKKTPELAKKYVEEMPQMETKDYVIFKPLDKVKEGETPEIIIFLVNMDQFAGLTTLANFDMPTQDNVRISFGAGCAQAILYGLNEAQKNSKLCYIGLTDPSARKCISKDVMSFTIPYKRFLEMEENVEMSFLMTETWEIIAKRID